MMLTLKTNGLIYSLLTLVAFSLFLVPYADAKTVIRSGNTVSVESENVIEGDFYAVSNIVNISGTITEDMVSAGGQITVNGSVGKDLFLVAAETDIHGKVGDDLRIISGEVTIADEVEGDLFIIGGSVEILSTASIKGDVVLYAGQAVIAGPVGGNVFGATEKLRIDAPVAGDVDVTVNQLTLGDRTEISGNLSYVSDFALIQSLDAVVSGEVIRNDPVVSPDDVSVRAALVPALVLLFSVLSWYMLSRSSLNRVVSRAVVLSPRSLLIGLASVFLIPIAAIFLTVSMIGSLVGTILILGYLLLLTVSFVGFSAVLGQLMMRLYSKSTPKVSLTTVVVGVISVNVLMLLPVLGGFLILLLVIVTFGTLIDLLIRPSIK